MDLNELPCAETITLFPLTRSEITYSLKYGIVLAAVISKLSPPGGGILKDRLQIFTCSSPCISAVSFLFSPCNDP